MGYQMPYYHSNQNNDISPYSSKDSYCLKDQKQILESTEGEEKRTMGGNINWFSFHGK